MVVIYILGVPALLAAKYNEKMTPRESVVDGQKVIYDPWHRAYSDASVDAMFAMWPIVLMFLASAMR